MATDFSKFDFNAAKDLGDVSPEAVPYRINRKNYLLYQASVEVALEYKNANFAAARLKDGKMVSYGRLADSAFYLVLRSLREVYDAGDGKGLKERAVHESELKGWKGEVLEELFEKCKEISPKLVEVDTIPSLEKSITKMQQRLKKLKAEEDTVKNLRTSTEAQAS